MFVAGEWRKEVARIMRQTHQIEEIDRWLRAGLKVAVAGLVLLGLSVFTQASCVSIVFRVLGGLCGGVGFFLGLGPFRAERLPSWTRELLGISPNYAMAAGTMILGAGGVALSLFGPW